MIFHTQLDWPQIVPKESAVLEYIGSEAVALYANHITIVKYESADDPSFNTVTTFLKLATKGMKKETLERWDKECQCRRSFDRFDVNIRTYRSS